MVSFFELVVEDHSKDHPVTTTGTERYAHGRARTQVCSSFHYGKLDPGEAYGGHRLRGLDQTNYAGTV